MIYMSPELCLKCVRNYRNNTSCNDNCYSCDCTDRCNTCISCECVTCVNNCCKCH